MAMAASIRRARGRSSTMVAWSSIWAVPTCGQTIAPGAWRRGRVRFAPTGTSRRPSWWCHSSATAATAPSSSRAPRPASRRWSGVTAQSPPSAPKAVLPIAAAGRAEAPPREVKPSPDGPRAPLPVVAAPAPRATVLAPRRAGPATDRVESALTLPAPSVAAPLPKPVASITPVAGISVGRETGSSASGSLRAVGVPAAFLALLAVAAYGFSRRRRGSLPRHIEILETTSLGPKRSLICARIGDETVLLGSSEAGITLLRGGQGPAISTAIATMAATPAMQATTRLTMMSTTSASVGGAPAVGAPVHHEGSDASATVAIHFSELSGSTSELDQPLEEALADIPEPGSGDHRGGSAGSGSVRSTFRAIEGGLAGLFGKKGVDFGQDEPSDRFEDLLEDSVEDQELRRKLAAGMSARIR